MFCNRCGHRNPEKSNFCSSCGAPLDRGDPDERATTAIPAVVLVPGEAGSEPVAVDASDFLHGVPDGGAVLVVTRGPNEGSRFVLGPDDAGVVTIGRHPDSDIFLDDITVSRRHAEVRRNDGRYWASDVGSLNGTYLNRQSIETASLSSGDELQVGKFRLLFLAPALAVGLSEPQLPGKA
ncbi:MAG TPA: FHA domain-containing protein [Acidimicrobiales bacterium]|nr:FHA domain-containing protein [Acidimicrobiales bacterium]